MAKISPYIILKMAFWSLRRHPIRSGLALLGIVIGISAMTVTMALGEGANQKLRQEILAMGENLMYIVPGNLISKGEVRKSRKLQRQLQYDDYLALNQFSSKMKACTPCVEKKELVSYRGHQVLGDIQGVNADFFRMEPRGLKIGYPFSAHHDATAAPVAILGSEAAKELFKKENPIGKTILIGTHSFQVQGVFNEAPKRVNRIKNPNVNVVIPFSSAWRKIILPDENHSIHHIILRPKEGINSAQLVAGMRRLLRFRHQINSSESDDFTIWDLQAMMQAAHKSSEVFNQFLLIAASISLVVGGIGIMNIMLVAMTERRKEIGIKMAIGATSGNILTQFLIESVLLCVTGGGVGILFGVACAYLIGLFTEFDWAFQEKPIITAFATTVIVGLFFGFYPAYKASKLNPIDALKSV
ncbi:MAG: ABC transporter permease [Parachlamydiaceae bacterium]